MFGYFRGDTNEQSCELVGRRGKPLWEFHCEWEKTDVLAAVQPDNESAPVHVDNLQDR